MNSVALPASATSTPSALSAEADLVRLAARGDADAFAELYRRHSQPAWRLAQAVAPDREAAIGAFRDGFVRAISTLRRARQDAGSFRTSVLAAVYKTAADSATERPAASPNRQPAPNAEAALANAAFRSLPDRWRAAVWLSEVENLDADRIAPILGVSSAVATQLVVRGRRGLAGRFTQAHRDVPELFGPVLRPLALAVPANLAEVASARWAHAGSERGPVLAPMASWLEDKALRPMTVAVGALLGLGLIGLGVVPQGSAVRAQLGASGSSNPGALPVQTCFGVACSPGATANGTALTVGLTNGFGAPTGSLGGGAGGFAGGSTGSPSSPVSANTGTSGSSTPGSGGTGSSGGSGTGHGSPPPTISTPAANVTVGGNSAGVTLLPSSNGGGGLATVTVGGSSPVCVTSGSTSIGCSSTNSTSPTTLLPGVTIPSATVTVPNLVTPSTTAAPSSTTTTPSTTTTLPVASTIQRLLNSTGL